ncbi:MAG: hypothetical protein HYV07_24120 [Deltaproteobacteria bacterium]|nr:hypothetical protein [Deltaproteobacteria bacterium]
MRYTSPFGMTWLQQARFALRHASRVAALFLVACPNPTPGPIQIDSVEPILDTTPSLRLRITGRGFGLDRVRFLIPEGQGGAEGTAKLVVKIFDDLQRVELSSDRVSVLSVGKLEAFFGDISLSNGSYGVGIFYGANPRVSKPNAFTIGPVGDAGIPDTTERLDVSLPRDSGAADGGAGSDVDSAGIDGSMLVGDLGTFFPDASPPDAGSGDTGAFVGSFTVREPLVLTSVSALPAQVTIRAPVPHARFVSEGTARPDGLDLAVYQGDVRLPHQWADRGRVGTDALELVVRLEAGLPSGATPGFFLYHGDPAAADTTSDAVFIFAERFSSGGPSSGGWFDVWLGQCNDRLDASAVGAICTGDDGADPTRKTLGTALVAASATPPAGTLYEMSGFVGGVMAEPDDILYFAYASASGDFVGARTLPSAAYTVWPPDDAALFLEQDGNGRTETGWHFDAPQAFTEVRARFVPMFGPISLHFRYISPNAFYSSSSVVGLDDLTLRLAPETEVTVAMGATERR